MKFGRLFSWFKRAPQPNIERVRLIVRSPSGYPWISVEHTMLSILLKKGIRVESNPSTDATLNAALLKDPQNAWQQAHSENTFLIIITHSNYATGTFRTYSTSGQLVAAGELIYCHSSLDDFANFVLRETKKQIAAQLTAAA